MYVYFLMASTAQWQRVKIGKARNVEQRMAELQTGSPMSLRLLGTVRCLSDQHARSVERGLHRHFAAYGVGGEWFTLTAPLRAYITAICAGDETAAREAMAWAEKQMRKRHRQALRYGISTESVR